MNVRSQLTRLILDYYRENLQELQQLKRLHSCKVFRRWGVLNIRCTNRETADALIKSHQILKEPIAQLRLAQKIRILVDNTAVAVLPVHSEELTEKRRLGWEISES